MNLGVRLRLTILYFSFFAVAATLLSFASWVLLKHSLDALLLHELDERIDDLEDFLSTENTETTVPQVRESLLREYRLKDEGKWLQVVTDHGEYVYFSSRGHIADQLPALPITGSPVGTLQSCRGTRYTRSGGRSRCMVNSRSRLNSTAVRPRSGYLAIPT
jgi:hypothetical protein